MNRQPTLRSSLTLRAVSVATALLVTISVISGCDTVPPDQYIALGDSYTSGPLVPNQVGTPSGCLRSDRDYPSVAAQRIMANEAFGLKTFYDVSCSGAQTRDFYAPQSTDSGNNIAQLDIVGDRAKVVTIGIGGNDIGFSGIITSCVAWQDCKAKYVKGGVDELRGRIDTLAPTIAQVINDVHDRAPQASVFVVGYPTIVPDNPSFLGCQTMTQSAITYLDGVEQYLNAMLQTQAESNNATYVDAYTTSQGHDSCALDPWVNGLLALPPVHPNAKGMAHTGDLVATAIETALAG